jgi:mono/diheme cytochrome c family protein
MRGRRLTAAIAVLVPVVLAGWTLTAVFAAETPSPAPGASPGASPAASAPAGDATHGAQVFGSAGCTACHGSALEGGVGPKLNPIQKLAGVPNPLDPNYLATTIRHGRSSPEFAAQMPAFTPDKLSDKDLADVVAYIIDENSKGSAGLGPVELARSNVFWVTVSVALMVLVTWLLARYNMRWIARRAAERQESGRPE